MRSQKHLQTLFAIVTSKPAMEMDGVANLRSSSSFRENPVKNESRAVRDQAVGVAFRIHEAMQRHAVTEGEPDKHQLLRADRILTLHLFLDFFDRGDKFVVDRAQQRAEFFAEARIPHRVKLSLCEEKERVPIRA